MDALTSRAAGLAVILPVIAAAGCSALPSDMSQSAPTAAVQAPPSAALTSPREPSAPGMPEQEGMPAPEGAAGSACLDIAASLAFVGVAPYRLQDGTGDGTLDEFAAEAGELESKVPEGLKDEAARLQSVLRNDGGGTGTSSASFDQAAFDETVAIIQDWIDRNCGS